MNRLLYKTKEEGKDQESIQSNTTSDLGHHTGISLILWTHLILYLSLLR